MFQALEHVAGNLTVSVTSDSQVIANARSVVFPGQGAMPDCVRELDARGLRESILDAAVNKPFLGMCIGLQLLFDHSEEGNIDGLGVFAGTVKRFPSGMLDDKGDKLKVPHMGWNEVYHGCEHPLWSGIASDDRFYFVHSYYVSPANDQFVAGWTAYPFRFASAVARDNIFAVQFHPEKSQRAGLKLLENFVNWDGTP